MPSDHSSYSRSFDFADALATGTHPVRGDQRGKWVLENAPCLDLADGMAGAPAEIVPPPEGTDLPSTVVVGRVVYSLRCIAMSYHIIALWGPIRG